MTKDEELKLIEFISNKLEIEIDSKRYSDYYNKGTKITVKLILSNENGQRNTISESSTEISD